MKIQIILLIVLGVFFINLVDAEVNSLGTFKEDKCVEIKQVCASCSYVNLSVSYENSSLAVTNKGMVNQGGGVWTYNFCNTTETGRYDILGSGDLSGTATGFDVLYFEITKTGTILTTGESLTYLILAFGVLLLFILSFYFMISIPYGNGIDDKGAVIKISKLKYIKIGLILLTWVLLTWFLNILIGLSDNFVSLTMYYGFFGFIFETMNNISLPLGIFLLVLSFFEIIKDANIQEAISKFGSSK